MENMLLTKKVLLIDDEPIINRLNKKILNSVQIESNSQSGISCLKGKNLKQIYLYDLLIIDFNLLEKDKGKILNRIKDENSSYPILISSGHLEGTAQKYLEKYDRVSYIQKPYIMEDFLNKVKKLLEV